MLGYDLSFIYATCTSQTITKNCIFCGTVIHQGLGKEDISPLEVHNEYVRAVKNALSLQAGSLNVRWEKVIGNQPIFSYIPSCSGKAFQQREDKMEIVLDKSNYSKFTSSPEQHCVPFQANCPQNGNLNAWWLVSVFAIYIELPCSNKACSVVKNLVLLLSSFGCWSP